MNRKVIKKAQAFERKKTLISNSILLGRKIRRNVTALSLKTENVRLTRRAEHVLFEISMGVFKDTLSNNNKCKKKQGVGSGSYIDKREYKQQAN